MIYITGDTHGQIEEFKLRVESLNLTREDIVIVCGDFGFNWDAQHISNWKRFEHAYTVLFCDGNHENYDVLNALKTKEMYGDTVGVFDTNTFRLLTGHMYDIAGVKTFVYGGASSIDKEWRLDNEVAYGKLWWKEEVPSPEAFELARQTLKKHDYKFDLFLSHTCRPELKGEVLGSYKAGFPDPVEDMIKALEEEIKENGGFWKMHCFGHFHSDKAYKDYCCLYRGILKWVRNPSERAGKGTAKGQVSARFYEAEAIKKTLALLERAKIKTK